MPITVTIKDESGSGRVAAQMTLELALTADTDIRFLRLMRLVGG